MADGPEDVLELDDDQALADDEQDKKQATGEADEVDDGEAPQFGFEGEEDEAAPASEKDSSVIRELRKRLRDVERENAGLRRDTAPKLIEVGEKPTLSACEYDEDRFEAELDAWNDRKAKRAEQDRQATERQQAETKRWDEIEQGYRSEVAKLNAPDFDEAEQEIAEALPREVMALILRTKTPGLVLALRNSPGKLAELSKLNLADAALMLGELKGRLKQVGTRTPPNPDRPVRGNAPTTTADKELARLEKKAAETGDRTELIAYRRKLKSKA